MNQQENLNYMGYDMVLTDVLLTENNEEYGLEKWEVVRKIAQIGQIAMVLRGNGQPVLVNLSDFAEMYLIRDYEELDGESITILTDLKRYTVATVENGNYPDTSIEYGLSIVPEIEHLYDLWWHMDIAVTRARIELLKQYKTFLSKCSPYVSLDDSEEKIINEE